MPDIVRVTGPWSDGNVLTAQQVSKDTFQGGREIGFNLAAGGGGEALNGQLDFTNHFNTVSTIYRRHIRRGSFTESPRVSGFRQSRDVFHRLFTDLLATRTPDSYERARPVLGIAWPVRNGCSRYMVDINIDYTVGSDQNLRESDTGTFPNVRGDFVGFMGVWFDDTFYPPSATPLIAGRSSTVEPPRVDVVQYFNQGWNPDFRRYTIQLVLSSQEATEYSLPLLMTAGWHKLSLRVSGTETIRLHGGSIIITPIV